MLTERQIARFHDQGYLLFPGLFCHHQIDALKDAADRIVQDFDADKHQHIFSTRNQQKTANQYFLDSEDKIRCFFEEDAFDDLGKLRQDKSLSINKIGHALHVLNDTFRQFSHQPALYQLARGLGQSEPQIHQSMYIFKQPHIGGEVRWHQDSTFFHTQPNSLLTFWVAIEDANQQNGCLRVQPGGHRGPLRERFIRTEQNTTELQQLDHSPWPSLESSIPVEAEKGSLLVFHGLLPHGSEKNTSGKSRHAYTMHLSCKRTHYAADNWIQAAPSRDWRY